MTHRNVAFTPSGSLAGLLLKSSASQTFDLLRRQGSWSMMPGERAAVEGVLAATRPALSIEIGTYRGGSLELIAAYSDAVHTFDIERRAEVTDELFPNATFHTGNSHELLPRLLSELASEGVNVDFAFVDGDHSADGVRRDVEDLLSSPNVGRTVILLHDTLLQGVRLGLEQIDYQAFEKVRFVDLDFVQGRVVREGPSKDALLGGLGLILTGWELGEDHLWPRHYTAPDVYSAFSEAISRGDETRRLGYSQCLRLEQRLTEQRELLSKVENSLSWRLTAPLRSARAAFRRVR